MNAEGFLLVLACVLIETVEQLLFRMAGRNRARYFFYVVPAITLHIAGLACWFLLLKLVPLGVALPLMGANYVSVALAGRYVFGEPVDRRRWAGVAMIVAGFALVATYRQES